MWLFGSVLVIGLPALAPSGHASGDTQEKATHSAAQPTHKAAQAPHRATQPVHHVRETSDAVSRTTHARVQLVSTRVRANSTRMRVGGMSCVPYARSATGITVAGNAWQWWDHAAGTYQRGSVPEPGSVLAFRANGRMHLGHVAVVTRVVNTREIEIDHANWAGGGVARGVSVVDVSENNDWTAVRVGLGRSDSFGSVYPTYGFIYDRPDTGNLLAAITAPAAPPSLNPPPRDLRPAAERKTVTVARVATREYDEVAEAPSHPRGPQGGTLTIDRQ